MTWQGYLVFGLAMAFFGWMAFEPVMRRREDSDGN